MNLANYIGKSAVFVTKEMKTADCFILNYHGGIEKYYRSVIARNSNKNN